MRGIKTTGMKSMQLTATYEVTLISVPPHLSGILWYSAGRLASLSTSAGNSPEKGKHTSNDLVRAEHVTL